MICIVYQNSFWISVIYLLGVTMVEVLNNILLSWQIDRYKIVEGQHPLWNGVSRPYGEAIRAYLVYFQNQVRIFLIVNTLNETGIILWHLHDLYLMTCILGCHLLFKDTSYVAWVHASCLVSQDLNIVPACTANSKWCLLHFLYYHQY